MDSNHKPTIKDVIILSVFGILVISGICIYIHDSESIIIGSMIEHIILITLSFITLIDVASYYNWSIFVPDFFEAAKNKKRAQEIKELVNTYIREDINFFQDYSEERICFLISQLGINTDQLDQIRYELIKMRCIPLKTIDDAAEKLKKLVINDYPIIIDQNKIDSSKICYHRVRYYINLTDIMYLPDYARELSAILAFLITENCDLSSVNKLIVPYDSNFLLAVEVGKRLGKSVVKMRQHNGKILTEKCWDGNLDNNEKVIIIHDVLVSGEQIIDAINKIPDSCSIVGFFCLIVRKEWDKKEDVIKKISQKRTPHIPCYQALNLDDNEISRLRKEE